MQMQETRPMKDGLNCPSGWRTLRRNKREDRKTKSCFDVSVWMCVGNERGASGFTQTIDCYQRSSPALPPL